MRGHIQIWFFSGILLLVYGVLIAGTGLWELSHPLPNPPVLYQLHPPIWWGSMMAAVGLIYILRFRPR
jgi:FtsH-binding integral membrane protein